MSWFAALPAIAVSVLLLAIPGAIITWLAGLRGLWAVTVAPVASLSLYALASLVLPLVNTPWTPPYVIGFTLILALAAGLALRGRFQVEPATRRGARTQAERWATPVAWLLATASTAALFISGVGSPDAFMQQSDNVFHLNLITSILERDNASPLMANALVQADRAFAFYPDLWHAGVSLVIDLTGADISVAVHSFNLVVAAGMWPLGMLLLVRQLVSRAPLAMLSAGILAASFTAFPMNLLRYGVLYAFFFGVVLVPIMLSVLLQCMRLSRDRTCSSGSSLHWGALLLVLAPAQAIAHPSALMLFIALSVPLVIVWAFRDWHADTARTRGLRLGYVALALALILAAWVVIRPSYVWPALYPISQSTQNLFLLRLIAPGVPFVLGALTLIGVIRSFINRTPQSLAIAGLWCMGAALYLLTASFEPEPLREALVGNWYGDLPRIAPALVIVAIPAAVAGLSWLLSFPRTQGFSRMPGLALTLALLFIATQFSAGWQLFLPRMQLAHTTSETSPMLTVDERKLIDRLPELVPHGAVIAGNPWTGTSLAYALGERRVLLAYPGAVTNADGDFALRHLRDADQMPGVCEALVVLRIEYVLDFGTQEPYDGGHRYPGIEQLEDSAAVELVAAEGAAKLYRVTACDFDTAG